MPESSSFGKPLPALLLFMSAFFLCATPALAQTIPSVSSLASCSGILGSVTGGLTGPTPICGTFSTTFSTTAGGGLGSFTGLSGFGSGLGSSFSSTSGSPSVYSPTNQVAQTNAKAGPWYLTCPDDPTKEQHPTDAYYFYGSDKTSFIAGDGCLAPSTTLQTVISLTTTVSTVPVVTGVLGRYYNTCLLGTCSLIGIATVNPLQVQNPGKIGFEMITYSPEVDGMLSNGFNTNSYIFGGVPSSPQHAIWTWYVEFANFANAHVGTTTTTTTTPSNSMPASSTPSSPPPSGSCPTSGTLTVAQLDACAAAAGFSTGLSLDTIVAISQAESSGRTSAINNNGGTCSKGANAGEPNIDVGVMQINTCAQPQSVSCTSTSFSSCTGAATTPQGAYQAAYSISNSGSNFNPWCTYYPTGCNGAAAKACTAPGYCYCQYMPAADIPQTQCPGGSGGAVANVVTTTTPSTSCSPPWCQTYTDPVPITDIEGACTFTFSYSESTALQSIANNYVPFTEVTSGSTGGITGVVSGPPGGTTTFKTEVLPYVYFNYSLNLSSDASATNPNLSAMSEDVYSPWNYYNPSTNEDEFPIDIPGEFFFCGGQVLSGTAGTSTTNACGSNGVLSTLSLSGLGISTGATPLPVQSYSTTGGSSTSLISTVLSCIGSFFGFGSCSSTGNTANSQLFAVANIVNPISITSTSNNYIYVLYEDANGNYNISVIRLYPQGYYSANNIQSPALPQSSYFSCSSDSICQKQWTNAWSGYWANVITEQGNVAYILETINVGKGTAGVASVNGGGGINGAGVGSLPAPVRNSSSGNITFSPDAPSTSNPAPVDNKANVQYQSTSATCPSGTTQEGNQCCPNAVSGGVQSCYSLTSPSTVQSGLPGGFVPTGMAADDSGDVFLIGSGDLVKIANVLVNGALCSTANGGTCNVATYAATAATAFASEIAVSPQLGNIYIAGPVGSTGLSAIVISGSSGVSSGTISVFSANSLTQTSTINLAYGKYAQVPAQFQTAAGGAAGGSSTSVPIAQLNIAAWLQAGGLFGVPIQMSSGNLGASTNLDTAANHHPIGLADVNGYLYVLDDWVGMAGGQNFNILMLRAINSTGSDIPINPSYINDVYSQATCVIPGGGTDINNGQCYTGGTSVPPSTACANGCTPAPDYSKACGTQSATTTGSEIPAVTSSGYEYYCISSASQSSLSTSKTYYSLAAAGLFQNNVYPPYGWIISASVGSQNFCSDSTMGCTNNPQSLANKPYFPVGPKLSTSTCSSTNNGAACGAGVGFSVSTNGTVAMYLPQGINFMYSELLIASFDVENYTKPLQNTPSYTCYEQSSSTATTSSTTPSTSGGCITYSGMSMLRAPVYYVNDPFLYLENQGSEKVFSYANQFNSEFTSGSGTPQSQTSSSCAAQAGNFSTPTNCFPGQSTSSSINIQQGLNGQPSAVLQSSNTVTNTPILTSSVSGYAFIPYKYTYSLEQKLTDITPSGVCTGLPIPSAIDTTNTVTVYSYAVTPPASATPISANVEGGPTYLQYQGGGSNNWYVQNLSDIGLYLSTHLLINISTDRSFGTIFVANASAGSNNYNLLNATQRLNYVINTINNWQAPQLSYQNISSQAVGPYYGPSYLQSGGIFGTGGIGATLQSNSNLVANFIYSQSFSLPPHFTGLGLFDWYRQEVYQSPLKLWIPNLTGYQRILYAFNDRFNNTIFTPIDVDIANLTQLNFTVTPNISITNPNQTRINITGSAGYYTYNDFDSVNSVWVPLPNAQVYLYYGEDLNYQGLSTQQAQLCAFGIPTYAYNTTPYPANCILSNPEYTGLNSGASTVTYMTSNSGTCAAPPNSLLYGITPNCNIYGNDGNGWMGSSSCSSGGYCIPIFVNGSGICTTQAGLMDVATTNTLGGFSYNTTVCGIGQAKILAQFYGEPTSPLEPISVYQSPLTSAANSIYSGYAQQATTTPFNGIAFTWAPGGATVVTQVGLFELGFGNITGIAIIVAAVAALLIVLLRSGSGTKK